MNLVGLKNLCTPAYLYLVINIIAIVLIGYQNYGNLSTYCVGSYSCKVSNVYMIFIIKIIYILFWTWILNLLCSMGLSSVSWILFLIPIVLLFISISYIML
jgi:hypothetical protein